MSLTKDVKEIVEGTAPDVAAAAEREERQEKEKQKRSPSAAKLAAERIELWESVEKVPNRYTKDFRLGTKKSTSITGYWFFEEATKVWGPCGIGWGYEILDSFFTDGIPLMDPSSNLDMPVVMSKLHTMKIRLWYPGCENGIVHFGHTPYVYRTSSGLKADEEYEKKSLTDAIKKALSMLGFAGEIFKGEFDDDEYAAVRKIEDRIAASDDKVREVKEQKDELFKFVAKQERMIAKAVTDSEVNGIVNVATAHLHARMEIEDLKTTCQRGKDALQNAKTERIIALTGERE